MQYRLDYGPIIPKQLFLIYTSMYALVTFLMAMLSWYVYVCCGVGRSLKKEYTMCMAILAMGTFTYIITPKVTFNGIFPRALHTREKTRYLTK